MLSIIYPNKLGSPAIFTRYIFEEVFHVRAPSRVKFAYIGSRHYLLLKCQIFDSFDMTWHCYDINKYSLKMLFLYYFLLFHDVIKKTQLHDKAIRIFVLFKITVL